MHPYTSKLLAATGVTNKKHKVNQQQNKVVFQAVSFLKALFLLHKNTPSQVHQLKQLGKVTTSSKSYPVWLQLLKNRTYNG